MDPITCCLLGICCPPGSVEQFETFVKVLAQHKGTTEKEAMQAALDSWPLLTELSEAVKISLKKDGQ